MDEEVKEFLREASRNLRKAWEHRGDANKSKSYLMIAAELYELALVSIFSRSRFTIEVFRKSVHLLHSIIPLIYYFTGDKLLAAILTTGLLIVFSAEESARIRGVRTSFPGRRLFLLLYRQEELLSLGAHIYILISSLAAIILFDIEAVVPGVLAATVSDFSASLVGLKFGKHKLFEKKTVEGTIAGGLTCATIVFFFNGLLPCVIATALFLLVETSELPVDDNLVYPLGLSAAITVGLQYRLIWS